MCSETALQLPGAAHVTNAAKPALPGDQVAKEPRLH
jgi:hypothetical protein